MYVQAAYMVGGSTLPRSKDNRPVSLYEENVRASPQDMLQC